MDAAREVPEGVVVPLRIAVPYQRPLPPFDCPNFATSAIRKNHTGALRVGPPFCSIWA